MTIMHVNFMANNDHDNTENEKEFLKFIYYILMSSYFKVNLFAIMNNSHSSGPLVCSLWNYFFFEFLIVFGQSWLAVQHISSE